jgi:hypothetical protein
MGAVEGLKLATGTVVIPLVPAVTATGGDGGGG